MTPAPFIQVSVMNITGAYMYSTKAAVLADNVDPSDLICVLQVNDHGTEKVGPCTRDSHRDSLSP